MIPRRGPLLRPRASSRCTTSPAPLTTRRPRASSRCTTSPAPRTISLSPLTVGGHGPAPSQISALRTFPIRLITSVSGRTTMAPPPVRGTPSGFVLSPRGRRRSPSFSARTFCLGATPGSSSRSMATGSPSAGAVRPRRSTARTPSTSSTFASSTATTRSAATLAFLAPSRAQLGGSASPSSPTCPTIFRGYTTRLARIWRRPSPSSTPALSSTRAASSTPPTTDPTMPF
mmetsp:Transcript_45167/g.72561  ORF Transcript_45167/g.72561 Transcript_45167/m.72561 type:complete len:230 (+) Transcript_45167:1622-2311(+)